MKCSRCRLREASDGLKSCAECRTRKKAYRGANPEAEAARDKAWYEANREAIAARGKAYREANREAIAARHKAWREANREAIAAYRAANQEARTAQRKAWGEANLEADREAVRRRNARKRAATVVPFTPDQLAARLSMWAGCWMCGGLKEHVDHVKPLSKGGPHMLANLRPACARCNTSKGSTWPLAVSA